MAATIYEWYGYRVADMSPAAAESAVARRCPFLAADCVKPTGICSIETASEPVIICPNRLYFDGHRVLARIASDAFDDVPIDRGADGWPTLVPGASAHAVAVQKATAQVGVLGGGWGGEVRLPPAYPEGPRYSVDFLLIVVNELGELIRFTPVEVQSMDTTNSRSLATSADRLRVDRQDNQPTNAGLNWENVNKRILAQLIVKGLMLQAEELCRSGIYLVTPESVYRRIMIRLGGEHRFRRIPKQPGSITFVRYVYDTTRELIDGEVAPLRQLDTEVISTSDLSLAFITPENLPEAGSYAQSIRNRLRIR